MPVLIVLVLASLFVISALITKAGVPVAVYGYIYMPDGSPAAGASVRVSGGGDSKSTTAGGSGGYSVTLNADKVPTSVSVSASKGDCSASASRSNVEGAVRIDLTLRCPTPPPTPTPSPGSQPSSSTSRPLSSEGEKGNASSQLKAESADLVTFLRISIREEIYHVNDTITVNGSITPPFKTKVELVFVKPSGKEFSVFVETDEKGAFSYKFKTNETGRWKVYARFPGIKGYLPSVTDMMSFLVKDFALINYNCSLQGRKLVVNGNVLPADPSLRVQLLISLDNESWAVLREASAGNGSFSFSFTTGICGTFKLKVASTETGNLDRSEGREIQVVIPCPKTEIMRNITAPKENITASNTTNLPSRGALDLPVTAISSFIVGFIIAALVMRRRYA
jgi:hypothetical protein